MSTISWLKTVEVGEELEILGPNGAKAHKASIGDAYNNGQIELRRNGGLISANEFAISPLGVDIYRVSTVL